MTAGRQRFDAATPYTTPQLASARQKGALASRGYLVGARPLSSLKLKGYGESSSPIESVLRAGL
jgi:hypothetical protein